MPMLDGLTGIVLGGVFGSIFVITCIISAIKAVRDRKVIKRRIAAKEQEKLKNGVSGNKTDSSIEEVIPSSSNNSQYKTGAALKHTNGSFERLDLSAYSIDRGVDNATFKHSSNDIKHANDNCEYTNSISTAEIVPSYQKHPSKRTHARDPRSREKINHLPPECLAVKKIMRSNSYERAVAENSWLPMDMSSHPTSKTTKSYMYADTTRNKARSTSNICFDNRAYDKNDLKRTSN